MKQISDSLEAYEIKHILAIPGCSVTINKEAGYFLLEPNGDEIRVIYYFHSEPSQNISPMLLNSSIHRMPSQTFLAFKRYY